MSDAGPEVVLDMIAWAAAQIDEKKGAVLMSPLLVLP